MRYCAIEGLQELAEAHPAEAIIKATCQLCSLTRT